MAIEFAVNVAGRVNKGRLERLAAGGLEADADKLARRYTNLMIRAAQRLAPQSAANPTTHQQHDTTLREGILGQRLGPARYRVVSTAPWTKYVITGTRAHTITAGRSGVVQRRSTRALEARLHRHERGLDRMYARQEHLSDMIERARNPERKARLIGEYADLGERMQRGDEYEDQLHLEIQDRKNSGVGQLVFPWEGGRWVLNGQHYFIGPGVNHPGTRANDFMIRARNSLIGAFGADLRRMLEGAGL